MASNADIVRIDNNIEALQESGKETDEKADKALYSIDKHEQICMLRYQAIDGKLGSIDEKFKDLKKLLFIVGIVIGGLIKSDKLEQILKLWGFGI